MTFPHLTDPADNPYLPRSQQNVVLSLHPDEFDYAYSLPEFLFGGADLIENGAHGSAMSNAGPVHDDGVEDVDDNSSETLDPIEDHEFPSYFAQHGEPPRLFHSHGNYSLPVDGDEIKRQEAQHILLRMITGRNYDAPLRELLNENLDERKVVIDLCTGAGHWVLEMAREFPHVAFRGLDRVPIQTRYPPDNVRFEIVDVTERLRFADASIDVVHARMVCLRAEAVPHFLKEVTRILRPGGLFLSAEWSVYPTLHPEHPCFTDYKALIPRTISFHNAVSSIVPTLAPHIIRLIGLTNSFEEPVSTRRAIPISVPYLSTASPELHFVSGVMQRIVRGYANALVAGGFVQSEDANAFKQELDSTYGIVSIYQTVFARKRTQGN